LLKKQLIDQAVANFDCNAYNYRILKGKGLQAFDYDFSCGTTYTPDVPLPAYMRFNVDLRLEPPTAVDSDLCEKWEALPVEKYRSETADFLRPSAIEANVKRIVALQEHLKTVERFDSGEWASEKAISRVRKFTQTHYDSLIGRDLTFATFEIDEHGQYVLSMRRV
jgi:hypothetical protein